MLPIALDAVIQADVVVGYKLYLQMIADLTAGKTVYASGMRKEMERCEAAIEAASCGRRVVIVSSGDAGIYGMAGLIFDLCRERNLNVSYGGDTSTVTLDFSIDVIPGVAAFNAAASTVGAPLMHDFAAISLSDHLTPWEIIEKRLNAAALADFVMAIYNPRSKSRPHLLRQAQRVILQHRPPTTPVALVRRAMREGQWRCLTTLDRIPDAEVDMQSVLIVGNSATYVWKGWMVTPRGYLDKYGVTI
ncbi:precorrin-3B C(17)-methyltransferase [Desulfoferrobacter suflitae]|uniref:precorrin-3B C(17)-methyltransferase n=1 Tax=Desulfoferrobacter suflitae TaxID=2865782 RepID=UPI0021646E77|nr:precorrin-3B C(17)-methyltransferase [Desulfoferrobacter suflitae]MCK8603218.1 precorrin-3B C(17)-methyltransferase [Desulfoferrobacter suflitae]